MQLNLLYGLLSRAYIEERRNGDIRSLHATIKCALEIYLLIYLLDIMYFGKKKKNSSIF